jgi:hypothetical protein
MKYYQLGILIFALFIISTIPSVIPNYAAAQIYPINIHRVPAYNRNCARFVPQFSVEYNKDPVS